MGRAKDMWLEAQDKDPNNWYTKKCKHCGDNYKVNKFTQPDNEFGWCKYCYIKIMNAD